jgi:hypothetical protein
MQTAAQLGVVYSFDASPKRMLAEFYERDPQGNIDRIFAQIFKDAPAVKQAEAKAAEAQANLDQAELDLRYCDGVAEIDGCLRRTQPGTSSRSCSACRCGPNAGKVLQPYLAGPVDAPATRLCRVRWPFRFWSTCGHGRHCRSPTSTCSRSRRLSACC